MEEEEEKTAKERRGEKKSICLGCGFVVAARVRNGSGNDESITYLVWRYMLDECLHSILCSRAATFFSFYFRSAEVKASQQLVNNGIPHCFLFVTDSLSTCIHLHTPVAC